MSAKRAYYIEYADKDMAVILVDDGETQAVMTASPEYYRIFVKDYSGSDFEFVALRSSLAEEETESEYWQEGHRSRLWHNIETGERVAQPLGQPWQPALVRS